MNKERFLSIFLEELRQNRSLYPYYKLNVGSAARQRFRQAYFLQRLDFIQNHIDLSSSPKVLDCGCGFGTTGLFLAMNGCATRGTTLEFYIDQIARRKQFWNQYGNADLFDYAYENIFDTPPAAESFDYIILQDTLHHIEPVTRGLEIFYTALKPGGKLLLIEENGAAWLKSLMLYLRRGNHRIIDYYDEKLQKRIMMGNENVRSEKCWRRLFSEKGFVVDESSVQYIRLFSPINFHFRDVESVVKTEQHIAKKCHWLKTIGFFGLNMVLQKPLNRC